VLNDIWVISGAGLGSVILRTRVAIDTGGAGNIVYDAGCGHTLVAVHEKNGLVAIDPATANVMKRDSVPGSRVPRGLPLTFR
jgi:hypothetical protein